MTLPTSDAAPDSDSWNLSMASQPPENDPPENPASQIPPLHRDSADANGPPSSKIEAPPIASPPDTAPLATPPTDDGSANATFEVRRHRIRNTRGTPTRRAIAHASFRKQRVNRRGLPVIQKTDDSDPPWHRKARALMPGWLVSLILHAITLALLATLAYSPNGQSAIALVVSADASADDDSDSLSDITLTPMEFDVQELSSAAPPVDLNQVLETELPEDSLLEVSIEKSLSQLSAHELFNPASSEGAFEVLGGAAGKTKGSGEGDLEGGARFFGIKSEGNEFVYIVDCSGSMSDEYRYRRAVVETERSLAMLKSHQKFLVVLYNHGIYPMLDTPLKRTRLISATEKHRKDVIEWMSQQPPNGLTMPMVAMLGSLELEPDAIFLLSDGEINDDTVGMLRRKNRKPSSAEKAQIPVNTVTLGTTGLGADIMRLIAKENNGSFVWVR